MEPAGDEHGEQRYMGRAVTSSVPGVSCTAEFSGIAMSGGVDVTRVKRLYTGVGDRTSLQPGGAGLLYIDDIGFGHPAPSDEVAAE